MKKLTVAILFFLFFGIANYAQEQNFTLVNGTDFVISYVYISPTDAYEWGEDVLTVDVLGAEDECVIYFDDYDECYWDIKAVAADGSEAVWTALDLCEYYVITLAMTEDGPVAYME